MRVTDVNCLLHIPPGQFEQLWCRLEDSVGQWEELRGQLATEQRGLEERQLRLAEGAHGPA